MKTQPECEELARVNLQVYVNGCLCNNPEEVLLAIQKMIAVGMAAHDVVKNGTMEVVQ